MRTDGTRANAAEGRLGERDGHVFRAIVEDYIRTGELVGSQSVAPRCEVSSATVRNVMADLEAQGLLEKPHTSAGRRPTDAGYRYYVDALLTVREPDREEQKLIEVGCAEPAAVDGCLQEASRLLHALSRHAGVVATPRSEPGRLRQIDLLRLSDGQILAVVVTCEGLVLNKILAVDFPVSAAELQRATRTLNGLLQDATVEQIRERLVHELQQKRELYDRLLERALTVVQAVVSEAAPPDLLMSGQSSLLNTPDLDLGGIRSLFTALEEKGRLLQILDQAANARSLQIYIGSESALGQDSGVALVTSPYGVAGQVLGAVGVIGPTRMDYARVIPLVDFTARTVSKVLSEH
jgi:heat-inducible transcriptional repressor